MKDNSLICWIEAIVRQKIKGKINTEINFIPQEAPKIPHAIIKFLYLFELTLSNELQISKTANRSKTAKVKSPNDAPASDNKKDPVIPISEHINAIKLEAFKSFFDIEKIIGPHKPWKLASKNPKKKLSVG